MWIVGILLVSGCSAAPDHHGIAARDPPGVIAVAPIVPQVAQFVEGAVAVDPTARIQCVGFAIALASFDLGRVRTATIRPDVPSLCPHMRGKGGYQ